MGVNVGLCSKLTIGFIGLCGFFVLPEGDNCFSFAVNTRNCVYLAILDDFDLCQSCNVVLIFRVDLRVV